MTPERKAWWDSLPAEEKYIRKLIKHLEDDKKRHKANIGFNPLGNLWRLCVKDDKMTIKLLRKQIAMRLIWEGRDEQDYIYCPTCHTVVACVDCLGWEFPKHCEECGQKLRWK